MSMIKGTIRLPPSYVDDFVHLSMEEGISYSSLIEVVLSLSFYIMKGDHVALDFFGKHIIPTSIVDHEWSARNDSATHKRKRVSITIDSDAFYAGGLSQLLEDGSKTEEITALLASATSRAVSYITNLKRENEKGRTVESALLSIEQSLVWVAESLDVISKQERQMVVRSEPEAVETQELSQEQPPAEESVEENEFDLDSFDVTSLSIK